MRLHARRAFLFTFDALLGSLLLLAALLVILHYNHTPQPVTQTTHYAQDALLALNTISIGSVQDATVQALIANGTIADPTVSVLDQIGTFWATNQIVLAENLTSTVLQDLLPPGIGSSLDFGGVFLYTQNGTTNVAQRAVSRRMITGIQQGEALSGSTSAAYLKRISSKQSYVIAYYGGFVGQGNITTQLGSIPSDVTAVNITAITVQLVIGENFNLSINGVPCTTLVSDGSLVTVQAWNVTACKASIVPGTNNITFTALGTLANAYIAGGFVQVSYLTSTFQDENVTTDSHYQFPQIDGIINLYDSVSAPGNITDWYLNLSFFSNYTAYLTLGNQTLFSSSGSNTTQNIQLEAHNLSWPSGTTLPLRFGTTNFTNITLVTSGQPADTSLVTDVSGSMGDYVLDACSYQCNTWQYNCSYQCNRWQYNCSYQCNRWQYNCSYACNLLNCSYTCRQNSFPHNTYQLSCLNTSGACSNLNCGACNAGYTAQNYQLTTMNTSTKSCYVANGTCSGAVCGACSVNYTAQNYTGMNVTTNSTTMACYTTNNATCAAQACGSCSVNYTAQNFSGANVTTGTSNLSCFTNGTCSGAVCGACSVNYTAQNYTGKNLTTNTSTLACLIPTGSSCSGTVCGSCSTNATAQNYTDKNNETKIQLAQAADESAVSMILNVSGDSAGLVSYNNKVQQTMSLTTDEAALITQISSYVPNGETCICCGLNRAKDMLNASTNKRFIILMTDGQANYYCGNFNTYTGTVDNSYNDSRAKNDTINSGQNACKNYNITVYTIGFGSDADTTTLKATACNTSLYYDASNVSQLAQIYQNITQQILLIANFSAQTLIINGSYVPNHLYYGTLDLNYTPIINPPAQNEILVKLQTPQFANCTTTLAVPPGLVLADASVTSYNGPYWTSYLGVNGAPVVQPEHIRPRLRHARRRIPPQHPRQPPQRPEQHASNSSRRRVTRAA